jgi:hypothetical protein
MNPYTHRSLAANDSVRILELQPGQLHDTLKARLLEVGLSNEPTFSALSYCWGTAQFDTLLECDGEALYITNSLAAALNHLRNDTRPLIIWIDQVCINQRDSSERSCQVQLMGQIYSSAHEVIVWLGLPTQTSDFMLDCMSRGIVAHADIPKFLCSIAEFCQRPWFERTWTVQEVVLSRSEPRLVCGHASFPWSAFCRQLDTLYQRFSQLYAVSEDGLYPTVYMKSINDLDTWKSYLGEENSRRADEKMSYWINSLLDGIRATTMVKSMRLQGSSATFPTQLTRTLHLKVTDPRDKVFGLLGMCDVGSDAIIPDYSKPVATVYSEAMAHLIVNDFFSAYPSLILDMAGIQSTYRFPSWVSDLTTQSIQPRASFHPQYLVPKLPETVNDSTAQASLEGTIARFSDDFRVLYSNGIELGVIKEVVHPLKNVKSIMGLDKWGNWFSHIVSVIHGRRIPLETILLSLCQPHSSPRENWDSAYNAFKKLFNHVKKGRPIDDTMREEDQITIPKHLNEIKRVTAPACLDNTFFVSDTQRIGRCIGPVAKGDVLVGLFGIDIPFILRKEDDEYIMIGIAHVADHSYKHVNVPHANGKNTSKKAQSHNIQEFRMV